MVIQKTQQQLIAELVENMINANKELLNCRSDTDKNIIERQIKYLDKKIDELVYSIYELTDDEIKIIEESLG